MLDQDEKISPMLEDVILLNVIKEIDQRLPNIIKAFYFHKMKREERLADFKTDILLHIPQVLEELEDKQEEVELNSFKQFQTKKKSQQRTFYTNSSKYCRMCFLSKKCANLVILTAPCFCLNTGNLALILLNCQL